jgi:hypothetical protein
LLDFPAPGTRPHPQKSHARSTALLGRCERFGGEGKCCRTTGHATVGPRHAGSLGKPCIAGFEYSPAQLAGAASSPDHVSQRRRAVPIAFAATPSLFILAVALLILPSLYSFLLQNNGMMSMIEALHQPNPPDASPLRDPEVRDAYEIYLVGTYGAELNSDKF